MNGWKRSTISLSMADGTQSTVPALVKGGLAVHGKEGWYKISHAPSGFCLADYKKEPLRRMEAIDRAEQFLALADWNKTADEIVKALEANHNQLYHEALRIVWAKW